VLDRPTEAFRSMEALLKHFTRTRWRKQGSGDGRANEYG
jgi:hypothetical protein